MDDQIRELSAIEKAITEGFEKVAREISQVAHWVTQVIDEVAQEIGNVAQETREASEKQNNALLEISEVFSLILEESKRREDHDDETSTLDRESHKKSKTRKGS